VRRALALTAVVLAGCGANVQDPGDPQARRVSAFAAHGRSVNAEMAAAYRALVSGRATPRETRNVVAELLAQATLAREDVESTVPIGAAGRVPTLDGLGELVDTGRFLHSYASGHQDGLPLARAHLEAAARAFAGASRALAASR
jgi:plasmid stability protein